MTSSILLYIKALLTNFLTLSHPYKLTYVVTKKCRSRCKNCNIWKSTADDELSLNEIYDFCKKNDYFSWVDLTGGEPTDRTDFNEIVNIFLQNMNNLKYLHFPTNGLEPLRITEMASKINLKFGQKLYITVSIDGPKKINDFNRGIPNAFEKSLETYVSLKKLGNSKVFIGCTVYKNNVDSFDEMIKEIKAVVPNFDERDLHINFANTSTHYYENVQIEQPELDQIETLIGTLLKKQKYPRSVFGLFENIYLRKSKRYYQSGKTPMDCKALNASIYMSEAGLIYPCIVWNKPLGSIRENNYSLQAILESNRRQELLKTIKAKSCDNCWTPCEAYQAIAGSLSSLI